MCYRAWTIAGGWELREHLIYISETNWKNSVTLRSPKIKEKMRDNMCLLLFLLVVGLTYLQAAVPQNKRQGMFGLCQGWGAGCSMNYRSQNRSHSKSSTSNPAPSSRNSRYSVPSYLFTSGNSWNPIGKRSAWYTDIAFLRSPLVSLLNIRKPKENLQYAPRYPLVYRSKQPVH